MRAARGLRRGAVVDHLTGALGLDRNKREKVDGYYHELETGLLDVKRVDPRVWEALAKKLKAGISDLLAWRPRAIGRRGSTCERRTRLRPSEPPRYLRADSNSGTSRSHPDEVDRLFGRAS
ncbi:MAG: hypothetical protein H0U03_00450 [Actinobacteria bacterium]|nr:hypothetical protein [Actinomycetota bacterium]